jgi:hypothetical protein
MKISSIFLALVALMMLCPSTLFPQSKDEVRRFQKEIKEQEKRQNDELKQRAKSPFVAVFEAPPDQIKAMLLPMLTTQGCILETDTPFQTSFWTEGWIRGHLIGMWSIR